MLCCCLFCWCLTHASVVCICMPLIHRCCLTYSRPAPRWCTPHPQTPASCLQTCNTTRRRFVQCKIGMFMAGPVLACVVHAPCFYSLDGGCWLSGLGQPRCASHAWPFVQLHVLGCTVGVISPWPLSEQHNMHLPQSGQLLLQVEVRPVGCWQWPNPSCAPITTQQRVCLLSCVVTWYSLPLPLRRLLHQWGAHTPGAG
jgi:hypothetical protein